MLTSAHTEDVKFGAERPRSSRRCAALCCAVCDLRWTGLIEATEKRRAVEAYISSVGNATLAAQVVPSSGLSVMRVHLCVAGDVRLE